MPTPSGEYIFSSSFRNWLCKHRPGVYKICQERCISGVPMLACCDKYWRPLRFMLRFPGIEAQESADFDRQIHTTEAAIVLDKHPDQVASEDRCD